MPNPVELTVKSQLKKLLDDLAAIQKQGKGVQEELEKMGNGVSEEIKNNTNQVKTYLQTVREMGGRVADQLRRDFKTLLSLEGLQASLKLTEQFRGTIKEAVTLNDVIRKLGRSFEIPKDKWSEFHASMVKGLGSLGLASDVGARVMEGLVDTPVRGQKELLEYSKVAGQLASLSGREGQEGAIAKGIANVIGARGGNVKDMTQVQAVAEDLRRAFTVTGKGPDEILGTMNDMFSGMSKDLRAKISTRGLAQLAAIGQVAGPNSTKFLEEFLSKSPIQRAAFEAQGFKGVFGKEGLDVDKFQKSSKDVLGRIGGDPRLAAKSLGLSDEAAEGFVRLVDSMDKVKDAQKRIRESTGDLNTQYQESLGLGEAFRANINRVKRVFAEPLAGATGGLSNLLSKTAGSDIGSAGTVLGGGALAAILAGGGLRGIGGGLLGGVARGAAVEGLTGRETVPVYVTNAAEIALGGAAGGKAGLLGGIGKAAGGIALAGAAGYAVGTGINAVNERFQGTTDEGFQGSAIERLIFKMDKFFGGEAAKRIEQGVKVTVDMKSDKLKAETQLNRGASQ